MFVIGSNRKEFENQGVNCICLHMSAVREMVAPVYKHLSVLTYSHLCFNVGLPPSFSLTEQQYPVCYWSNIMIKGAVSAVSKTVRPSSCVIQLFTVRDKSSLTFHQDDLGKSKVTELRNPDSHLVAWVVRFVQKPKRQRLRV